MSDFERVNCGYSSSAQNVHTSSNYVSGNHTSLLNERWPQGGNKKTKSRSIESHVDLLLLERRKDLLAIEKKKKKVTTKMILILHETTCEDAGQSHPIPIAVHVLCLCH